MYLLSATFLFSAGHFLRLFIGDVREVRFSVSQVNEYFCILWKKWHVQLLLDMKVQEGWFMIFSVLL